MNSKRIILDIVCHVKLFVHLEQFIATVVTFVSMVMIITALGLENVLEDKIYVHLSCFYSLHYWQLEHSHIMPLQ